MTTPSFDRFAYGAKARGPSKLALFTHNNSMTFGGFGRGAHAARLPNGRFEEVSIDPAFDDFVIDPGELRATTDAGRRGLPSAE